MAEFWRALKTLKALQAERALEDGPALATRPLRPAAQPPIAHRPQPNEPERRSVSAPEPLLEYVLPDRPRPGGTLHQATEAWTPNEPGSAASPMHRGR